MVEPMIRYYYGSSFKSLTLGISAKPSKEENSNICNLLNHSVTDIQSPGKTRGTFINKTLNLESELCTEKLLFCAALVYLMDNYTIVLSCLLCSIQAWVEQY